MTAHLRDALRDYISEVLDATGWSASELAAKIKAAPSTINRFMNDGRIKHILSFKTIKAIQAVSGRAIPPSLMGVNAEANERGADATDNSAATFAYAATALYDALLARGPSGVRTTGKVFSAIVLSIVASANRGPDGTADRADMTRLAQIIVSHRFPDDAMPAPPTG